MNVLCVPEGYLAVLRTNRCSQRIVSSVSYHEFRRHNDLSRHLREMGFSGMSCSLAGPYTSLLACEVVRLLKAESDHGLHYGVAAAPDPFCGSSKQAGKQALAK